MKEIAISLILENMIPEGNYVDDLWKKCLDEKRKRYRVKDIKNSLKKLEMLGFIKKNKRSTTEARYDKISYTNPEDYLGHVNNVMFSNESKIKKSLKRLENRKIFVDISKNLNSYKLGRDTKIDYEILLDAFSNMTELASSILLVKETSKSEKFKKQLTDCHNEIKETLEQTNQKITLGRKSTEIILLERHLSGKIPSDGFLKL